MVFAYRVHDVLEVPDDGVRGLAGAALPEEARLVHDPDSAAGSSDRAELLVVDVSPVRIHAAHARVRHDERKARIVRLHRIEKSLPVDVREVDEDPLLVEPPHVVATEAAEAAARELERRARHADARAREVNERHAQDDVVGDEVEGVEALVEGVPALDADEGAVLARGARLPVLARVADERFI